ncbi:MAG: asparagine synthase C-terminal domain-containing protein [Mariniblastus sp.]|nr:asparagine synthase C-terminal domain-containing protein [Mariniblastus sp.]
MATWPETAQANAPLVIHSGHELLTFTQGDAYALLRGYIAGQGKTDWQSQQCLLEQLLARFISRQDLQLAAMEGSFTLLLATANPARLMIFRNVVGNTFTYYRPSPNGIQFSNQLAELGSTNPVLNQQALPSYFIYRFSPGRETLFQGIKRLLPGEQLLYESGELRVETCQTYANLASGNPITRVPDAIECVESAMTDISRDQVNRYPSASGLLSGGVDSSYIQAHWNLAWQNNGKTNPPRSAAFWLNETRRLTDQEYTLSAVELFETEHLSVEIEELTADTIRQTLRTTGEMPNHVQSFYFPALARRMKEWGSTAGLCGEGADGLFGTDDLCQMIKAGSMAQWLPARFLRQSAARLAELIGKPYRAEAIRLSGHLDDLDAWVHPINQNAAFTDWATVVSCFGQEAAQQALVNRQELLQQQQVPDDRLHLQHILTVGFLGEAVNTAAYWTSLFNLAGLEMTCPFLDSRMLTATLQIPTDIKFPPSGAKVILKHALARHVPTEFVQRTKRGFGQPIIKWMSPGGPLRPAVEAISPYDFLPDGLLARLKLQPNWFLYNLLVFDLWYKEFFESP